MRSVILTVHFVEAGFCQDLELPAEVPVSDLLDLLRGAHPEVQHIAAHPPGRQLEPLETLSDAGVLDGGWLIVNSNQ